MIDLEKFRDFYIIRYSYYVLCDNRWEILNGEYNINNVILNEWKQKLRQDKLDQIL